MTRARTGTLAVVRGAGDIATGTGRRLHRAGLRVVMTEIAAPLCVRRQAAFAAALEGAPVRIEGVEARRATLDDVLDDSIPRDVVAVVPAPHAHDVARLAPDVIVDARMLKSNPDTKIDQAPIVGALGPGFTAGVDCHFVVETCRGHDLGRVLEAGSALADTGRPAIRGGHSVDRVLYSELAGRVEALVRIGDRVEPGDSILRIGPTTHRTRIAGIVRGLLRDGTNVDRDTKVADVDPLGTIEACRTISDRSNAIAGGVLEGVLSRLERSSP